MDLDTYEDQIGRVNDNYSYNSFLGESGRRTGRTTALIQSLSHDKPCAIIVHRGDYKNALIKKIKETRPYFDINKIRFVVVPSSDFNPEKIKELDALKGFIGEVFVDNCLMDVYIRNVLNDVNKFYDREPIKKPEEPKSKNYNDSVEMNFLSMLMKEAKNLDDDQIGALVSSGLRLIRNVKGSK